MGTEDGGEQHISGRTAQVHDARMAVSSVAVRLFLERGFDDVVFLANDLHHFTPAQIADPAARVRASSSPGATVAICEVVQPAPDEPAELMGDAFALFFRLSSTARCYTTTEYAGWLADDRLRRRGGPPLSPRSFARRHHGRTPEH